MRLALFQPDIAANTGTILRLCACLDVPCDVIEPCGFPFSAAALKRAGMDYLDYAEMERHADWPAFEARRKTRGGRLIALSSKAALPYTRFRFAPGDVLLAGRESAGLPEEVQRCADARVVIPMRSPLRSLNVALAAAIVLGEALRQVRGEEPL